MPQSNLTPHQAAFILEKALADRKLTDADIAKYLGAINDEIADLQERIARLTSASGDGPYVRSSERQSARERSAARKTHTASSVVAKSSPSTPTKKRRTMSPERKASMQIQGRYISYLRRMSPKDQPKFSAMAKKDGREKAIAAMKKMLG